MMSRPVFASAQPVPARSPVAPPTTAACPPMARRKERRSRQMESSRPTSPREAGDFRSLSCVFKRAAPHYLKGTVHCPYPRHLRTMETPDIETFQVNIGGQNRVLL